MTAKDYNLTDTVKAKEKIAVFDQTQQLVDIAEPAADLLDELVKAFDQELDPVKASDSAYRSALAGNVEIEALRAINESLHKTLNTAASRLLDSEFMKRYIAELKKSDRERWVLSEIEKAKIAGAHDAMVVIKKEAGTIMRTLADKSVERIKPNGGAWITKNMFLVSVIAPIGICFVSYLMGKQYPTVTEGQVGLLLCAVLWLWYIIKGIMIFFSQDSN